MRKKVRNFIEERHMVEKGDCVLAAVSGGADSLCLLLTLLELRKELEISLCAVHVEHGIRGKESLEDAEFVEKLCRGRQVPCKVYHCNAGEYASAKKLSLEEGARALRYQFFERAAGEFGADKIAVAHNQNDCAETMLFHLARGTGLKGLRGIPLVREKIIRPLMCVTRQEIEAYLVEKKQTYCTDLTNGETVYTRNKIRRQVLPALCEINPGAVVHMNRSALFVSEAVELIDELAEQARKAYVCKKADGICILQELLKQKPVIFRETLRKALAEISGCSRDISSVHIRQLQGLFSLQNGRNINFPGNVEARRIYEGVLLRKKEDQDEKQIFEWELSPGGVLCIPPYGYEIHTRLWNKIPQKEEIPQNRYTKWMDYDKIKGTMRMRTRREHDFLVIDAQGGKKKLKKYFVDEKVPGYQRDRILLLTDDSHILWVLGYRISEDVKVTEHTRRVLEIRVNGGTAHE
ncbi:tRNA lysidine(34) synthetase TilS [Lachnospiraceae bacterium]|nr:tRNA lysidine(34) synthetase TilS [Lachnospiraceae bacterium]